MKAVAAGLLVVVIVVVSAGLGWLAGAEGLGKGKPEMTTEVELTDQQRRSVAQVRRVSGTFGQLLDQLQSDYPGPESANSIDQARHRVIEAEMWAIRAIIIE